MRTSCRDFPSPIEEAPEDQSDRSDCCRKSICPALAPLGFALRGFSDCQELDRKRTQLLLLGTPLLERQTRVIEGASQQYALQQRIFFFASRRLDGDGARRTLQYRVERRNHFHLVREKPETSPSKKPDGLAERLLGGSTERGTPLRYLICEPQAVLCSREADSLPGCPRRDLVRCLHALTLAPPPLGPHTKFTASSRRA
jgi:hypothetical protein